MKQKKLDKVYQIRVKGEDLQNAIEYCQDNNVPMATELRNIIIKYSRLYTEGCVSE